LPHVLLVEDDQNTREGLVEILSYEGYTVDTANNGREGIAAARPEVDIVVSDLRLPDLSGLQVVAAVKRVNSGAASIIMTAYTTPESYTAGKKMGIDFWLTKPLDIERLLSAVEDALLRVRQNLHCAQSVSDANVVARHAS